MELRQVEIKRIVPTYRRKPEGSENEVLLGTFHCWEHYKSEDSSYVRAVVELENGQVEKFEVEEIKFTNKPIGANLFEDGI